ncbi:MAG: hypothetical protein LKG11_04300 [Bacilli bacterium]|jgi:F-type H+-transporting ATPase subunit epsilon|nr:hypothetical protein [Bacilli bacterium]
MKPFSLVILTNEGVLYDGEALSLYVSSSKGPLGLLPGYTPTIAELSDGVATLVDEGNRKIYFALGGGALEVKPEKVFVLASRGKRFPKEEDAKAWLASVSGPQKGSSEVERAKAALTGTFADYKQNTYNRK